MANFRDGTGLTAREAVHADDVLAITKARDGCCAKRPESLSSNGERRG
jgi:hypothetical protein